MNKVVPNDSGCWIWQGTTSHYGHGRMIFHGRREATHRVSYVLHKGAIPDGAYICHTCDAPSCVNPDHLYAGDAVSNARDMVLRERQARGDRTPRAKLTAADVQSIRSSKSPGTHLARQYGVSSTLIYQIRKRVAWRHV